jgi:hypothetical protein
MKNNIYAMGVPYGVIKAIQTFFAADNYECISCGASWRRLIIAARIRCSAAEL